MKRIMTWAIIVLFTINSQAQNLGSLTEQVGLASQIMQSTGVDQNQALGGAGALFGMAKEGMSADDFSKVTDAVPEMSKMMDAVPNLGGGTSTLSSAATALVGMPKVTAAFEKLGISKDKIALFTPVIVSYIEKKAGSALSDKVAKSLKK